MCSKAASELTKRKRCAQCLRPLSVCYCSQITQQQDNHWPVYIVQDSRESRHAIGTARIAALSLSNCQLISINPDQYDESCSALQMLRSLQPVLVYPGDEAADISELTDHTPQPLLFIDASWRRSRKILNMLPWIAELPRYSLSAMTASRYRIRQQPFATALSTLEAIVNCLQQLEPAPERFNALLSTMDWVVDQQINRMGSDTWHSNYLNNTKRSV